jgi:hypothetical protein
MPLPGKAMHVAIQLWHDVDLAKSDEVSISMTGMAKIGISRFAAARGLATLERAGLVSVVRRAGRKAKVVILATPAQPGAAMAAVLPTGVTSSSEKDSAEAMPLPLDEPAFSGD